MLASISCLSKGTVAVFACTGSRVCVCCVVCGFAVCVVCVVCVCSSGGDSTGEVTPSVSSCVFVVCVFVVCVFVVAKDGDMGGGGGGDGDGVRILSNIYSRVAGCKHSSMIWLLL